MDSGVSNNSAWNGAGDLFERLHKAFLASDEASMHDDRKTQLKALFTVHREIAARMTDQEREDAEKLYRLSQQVVNDGRYNPGVELWRLYKYELHLRMILKRRKMDLPAAKDPGRAIIGGKAVEGDEDYG